MVRILEIDRHMRDISQIQSIHVLVEHAAVGRISIFIQAEEPGVCVHGILQILSGSQRLVTGEDDSSFSCRQTLQKFTFLLLKTLSAAQNGELSLSLRRKDVYKRQP